MPVKITIIGLGQIGASMGLALAAHKDKVVTTGHDKEYSVEGRAKKLGAVDQTSHNLPNAVENADLVVLALPLTEIRDTFHYIAQDLRKDAVVVDTSPVKAQVAKWAQELLPESAHYVGIVPAIGAKYLAMTETGLDSARVDLFSKGIFLLSAPPGTPGEAVKLVSDFVELLGSTAILTDFVESDGLMASTHLLPQLLSAALLNATIGQPGWNDLRKTASRNYFTATSTLTDSDGAEALGMASVHDRENVVRALNAVITSLIDLRDDLEGNEDAFRKRLDSARNGRVNWILERGKADWTKMPDDNFEKPSLMETLLGSKLGKMGRAKDRG
ncbi:MAG: prephenate dehydrogenase/arogenate dehydrogenase family protein [Anaerolineales bacterium]|nr:prephenate dehydrogenase/arogenate dehydrogenase family protein [Anaerolineales bacterium]